MQTLIRYLTDETINQIAAGEVIENPASVVKELVENALDAGAEDITVEVYGGGLQLVRIKDSGSGMGPDDALLSLKRHATSKIKDATDLFSLATMGFRGEALASIAAISKLTLTTSLGHSSGTKIEVEGGEVKSVEIFPRNKGTTIEVRSLFYNVPARKKFQKSQAVCNAEITKALTMLSLNRPDVGFTLYQGEERALYAPALGKDKYLERAQQTLGDQFFFPPPFFLNYEEKDLKIQGYLSPSLQTRHNRTGQYLFINKRAVVCPSISYAVKDGYGTRIPLERYPLFLLFCDLDPKLIDVNVHPQKTEIRLQEERVLKEKIQKAVSLCLEQKKVQDPITLPSFSENTFSFKEFSFERNDPFLIKEEPIVQDLPLQAALKPIGLFSYFLLLDSKNLENRVSLPFVQEEGMILVDLWSAKARVLFESFEKKQEPIETQGFLLPMTIELEPAESEIISKHLILLEQMGIGIRPLGNRSFLIDSLPIFIEEDQAQDAVLQFAEEMFSFQKENLVQKEKIRRLITFSAKFAKGQRRSFAIEEAMALFEELLKCSVPYECPQGKPIFSHVSLHDIERNAHKKGQPAK